MSMFRRVSRFAFCSAVFLLFSCNLFTGSQNATIHVVNRFATEVTHIEYNSQVGTAPIAPGASVEDDIIVPANRTGMHKVYITVSGIGDMVSIDDVYTQPGGMTKIALAASLFMNL